MELALLVWVVSSLNAISFFLVLLGIAFIMFAFICAMNCGDNSQYNPIKAKSWWKWSKINAGIACTILAFNLLIPSEKTAWMMIGAATIQTAAQSEAAKKVIQIAETKLDIILEEALANAQKKTTNEIDKLTNKEKQ